MTEQKEDGELKAAILGELARSTACLHLTDIAGAVGTRVDSAFTLLRRMEGRGLAERVERGCWQATDAGRDYVERMRAHLEA